MFSTFQKLLKWYWQKTIFEADLLSTQMRYFEVEIFSAWCLDIYSFYKELDCWSGNIFWSLSWPLCFTVGCLKWQTIWYYFYHFGAFKDDSEPIYVTMLNVTVDVAMIFHMGNLLHLLQLVVILFLWLFWYISLSSARDGKENGDILKIIHYLKQIFRGQPLELVECYARCLLATVSEGSHQDK